MKKNNRKESSKESQSALKSGVIYYAAKNEEQFPALESLLKSNKGYQVVVVADEQNPGLAKLAETNALRICKPAELVRQIETSDADWWFARNASSQWNVGRSLNDIRHDEEVDLYLPGTVQHDGAKPGIGGLLSRLFYLKMNAFFSPASERHSEYQAFLIGKNALLQVLRTSECPDLSTLHHRIIQQGYDYETFKLVTGEMPQYTQLGVRACKEGVRSYLRWFFPDALSQFRNKSLDFNLRLQGLSRFLFAGLFFLCLVGMPWLSKDYGITWDEKLQYDYAKDIYAYLISFGEDKSIFDFANKGGLWQPMQYYGSFFDVLTVAIVDVFEVENEFELRHFLNALFGVFGLLFCGLIARALTGNWTVALLSFVFLLLTPSYFGHSMNNPKDVPFATGFYMSVYFMILFIKQLPRPSFSTLLLLSLSIGLSMSIRVGGILIYPYILLFGGIKWLASFGAQGSSPMKQLPAYLIHFLIVLVFGWLLGCLFWPYAHQNLIMNPIEALKGLSKVTYTTSYEIFEGRRTYMSEVPWYYSLKWMWIGSAVVVLAGLFIQVLRIPFSIKKDAWKNGMLLFMFLFPVLWAVVQNSMLYNGWRHWFFVYGNVAILAAMGWTWMIENRRVWMRYTGIALVLTGCAPVVAWMVRSHPNQYIYFNELTGGLPGAYGYYETDYYSNTLKEAVEWFVENVDVKSKRLTVVTNNEPLTAQYYMNKYTDSVDVLWTREYELTKKEADYAILTSRTMSQTTLLEGYYPPRGTIYTVERDGVPLCAIVQRENTFMPDGVAALESNRVEEAVQHFRNAAAYDPGNEEAWRHLGLAYANLGPAYQDSALQALNKALEVLPESFITYDIIGMIYTSMEKYDTAVTYFQKSIEYKINYTNGHYNLGIAWFNLGNYADAAKEFENSIRYGGHKPQFYKLLGAANLSMGQVQAAIQYLTYAVENGGDWEAYKYLADAYQASGKPDVAKQLMDKALQLRGN